MRSVALSHRLAVRLHADVRAVDQPVDLLLDLPGSVREDIFPTHTVTATVLHDDTTTIDALEAAFRASEA